MINDEYKKYLEEIMNEYYKVHINPEHNISRIDIEEYIKNYLNEHNVTNNFEFGYFILSILKRLNGSFDTHTRLRFQKGLSLPFELKFLQDGFYVINSLDEDIKYSKLVKINGIDIEEICSSMEKITSYETIYWLYLREQKQLCDIYFLRLLPEIGSGKEEFVYTFEKDNEIIVKHYTKESVKEFNNKSFDDNATYRIVDGSVIYKLSSCLKDEKYGFKAKIDKSCIELTNIIESQDINSFILDLRGNNGGSDTILHSLFDLFDKYINKIKFIVLVDRGTFSCGTTVLNYLLERGKVITIGEGLGEPFNSFSNYGKKLFLGDDFYFHVSNKYYCFNDNHLVVVRNKEEYNNLSDEQKSLFEFVPDVVVNESIDDIRNGRDLVLEIAFNMSVGEKNMDNNLYDMIFKRKSFHLFRNIGNEHITLEELEDIENYFKKVKHLVDDIKVKIKIIKKKSILRGQEYCILFYSEKKDNYLQNIGYIGEQLDLYLVSKNIGTLWFGIGKPDEEKLDGLDYVIMIAIAKVDSSLKFRKDMFKSKRKELSEIWVGDNYLDVGNVVRFCPSACNTQPWKVDVSNKELKVFRYRKEGKRGIMPKDKVIYYNQIDIGIFLCFLELCLQHDSIKYRRELFKEENHENEYNLTAIYKL